MLETLSRRDPHPKTKSASQAEAAPVAPPCAMVIFGAAGNMSLAKPRRGRHDGATNIDA
jgi:hypothetical protein